MKKKQTRPPRALGLQGQIFLVPLILITISGLASAFWLEGRLQGLLVTGIERDLRHAAQAAAVSPDLSLAPATVCRRLATATEARITVIARDGTVLGDSEITDSSKLGDHSDRPEIRSAWATGTGSAQRYSASLEQEMLYVAVWTTTAGDRVVRASRPLDQVEQQLIRLRILLGIAGLLGLAAAALLSGLASRLVTRDLRALVARTRRIAPRLGGDATDELAGLRGSFDLLSAELQRAIDALAEERDRTATVLATMREGVMALDAEGRISGLNPAARAMLGLGEVRGQSLVDLVEHIELVDSVRRALAGISNEAELVIEQDLAPPQVLHAAAMPLSGGGAAVVLRDVTALNRLERVRRDFVANVSHELRTPISIIQTSAEALVAGALSDPVHGPRFADSLVRNTERLGALIGDLLALARAEAGKQDLVIEMLDVGKLAHEALEHVRPAAKQELALEVEPGLQVEADARALARVLANLLDNACKYTPENGRILLRASRLDSQVRIEVADNGPGIPIKHRPRLFERFYRVDPGRSRQMGGTGLGLALVRHLVEAQGGHVEMVPNEPQGSVFRVTLWISDS